MTLKVAFVVGLILCALAGWWSWHSAVGVISGLVIGITFFALTFGVTMLWNRIR